MTGKQGREANSVQSGDWLARPGDWKKVAERRDPSTAMLLR
jgi:hypothetical protein